MRDRGAVAALVAEPARSRVLAAIEDLTRAEYDSVDAVNISTLKSMAVSPRHYQHALSCPRPDTDSMRLGRLMHAMVFEPDTIDAHWVVWDGGRRAGKEWEAFLAANVGKELIRAPEDWEAAEAVAAAVQAHPVASRYLRSGKAEQTLRWTDRDTGLLCKGRADWIAPSADVVDLKTTRDISPRAVQRGLVALAYHAQAAFYCDGLEAMGHGPHGFCWIYVEQSAPYDVAVYTATTEVLSAGRDLYRGWLARVVECRASGCWPGVAPSELQMELPAWAVKEDGSTDEVSLIIGGRGVAL
ncbi:MAG: PD-(D/E)XK nuclease-like domain-containing protein [bacterium]